MSYFVVLFSALFLFRLQLSVFRPNRSQIVRIELPCISVLVRLRTRRVLKLLSQKKPFLCEGALRHRNTRELYSNNLRAVGPNHAELKTKQNRKQDNKIRHKDQEKVNK